MNSNSGGIEVLASTTWRYDKGCNPTRIVLCRKADEVTVHTTAGQPCARGDGFEYIVWMEVNPEGEVPHFTQGDYTFRIEEAWEYFARRSQRHLNVLDGCDYPIFTAEGPRHTVEPARYGHCGRLESAFPIGVDLPDRDDPGPGPGCGPGIS